MTKYNPIFHKDGTVTYWLDSYGWFHRKHKLTIPGAVVAKWSKKYRDKFKAIP